MIFESFGGDGSDAAVAVAAFAMSLTVFSQSSLLLSSTTAAANLPESVVVDKIYKNEKKQKEEKVTLRRERELGKPTVLGKVLQQACWSLLPLLLRHFAH